MNLLAVCLVYAGLAIALIGAASLVKPFRFLGIRSRMRGLLILCAGLVAVGLGIKLPTGETRVRDVSTRLDEFVPVYQFSEHHSIAVKAPPDRVYSAIKDVGPEEILFFKTLTWMRRFGRRGPESILSAPERRPLLETATRSGFMPLAEDPGREILIGVASGTAGSRARTPEQFKELDGPRVAKIAMNFRVQDADAAGCTVTTETRVYASDAAVRGRFAAYWRVIYPGSALIRRMWLRAIKRRAEGGG